MEVCWDNIIASWCVQKEKGEGCLEDKGHGVVRGAYLAGRIRMVSFFQGWIRMVDNLFMKNKK